MFHEEDPWGEHFQGSRQRLHLHALSQLEKIHKTTNNNFKGIALAKEEENKTGAFLDIPISRLCFITWSKSGGLARHKAEHLTKP